VTAILPPRGRWRGAPEGASTRKLPRSACRRFRSGSLLTPCAGASLKGRHRVALALLLALAACSPKTHAPGPVALDCKLAFDALKAKVTGQPGLVAAPANEGEPYRAYSTADGRASWFVTEPGAPAHPAILMQQVTPQGLRDTGCAYGDKAAYDQLQAYLKGLSAGRR
jgi:hypothetical protein